MKREPKFYIFDMDHTLINADCDVTWKSYGVAAGIAPENALELADAFYRQYQAGTLDPEEFMQFQFREFIGHSRAEMEKHAHAHFEQFIRSRCYVAAQNLVKSLLACGTPVAILTSTNTTLARPVADYFGIREVMGTTLELVVERDTARTAGNYTVGAGKIAPAEDFARRCGGTLEELAYYGDSINDLNLLERVGFPVAANPDETLRRVAAERGWPVIDFGLL